MYVVLVVNGIFGNVVFIETVYKFVAGVGRKEFHAELKLSKNPS